ncbi:hypothetical protein SDC9_103156 [bioreactor metagenome]|uniref:Uncharacterized protein n=1 Tax=bioreactor metagenome TaxID=1076179 RepID=A0A645B3Q5_9ZZZZ
MSMDPSDTNLLRQTASTNRTSDVIPTNGYSKVMTDADTATPFPPLKRKKMDQLCPQTTANPAI